jgi:hypothetical protein
LDDDFKPRFLNKENFRILIVNLFYFEGFEIVIHNRKYFAYSYYEGNYGNVTSYCHRTFPGWAHVTGVNPGDWSCYVGYKYKQHHSKSHKKENYDLLEK